MTVTLSPEHEKLVDEKVQRGEYESADAVVAHALTVLIERERKARKAIREKIDRGIEQLARGEGLDGEEVFEQLEEELNELDRARQAQ